MTPLLYTGQARLSKLIPGEWFAVLLTFAPNICA